MAGLIENLLKPCYNLVFIGLNQPGDDWDEYLALRNTMWIDYQKSSQLIPLVLCKFRRGTQGLTKEQSLPRHTLIPNAYVLLRSQCLRLEEAPEHAHHRLPQQVLAMILWYLAQLLAAIIVWFLAIWIFLSFLILGWNHHLMCESSFWFFFFVRLWLLLVVLWVYALIISISTIVFHNRSFHLFLCSTLQSHLRTCLNDLLHHNFPLACLGDLIGILFEAWTKIVGNFFRQFSIGVVFKHSFYTIESNQ